MFSIYQSLYNYSCLNTDTELLIFLHTSCVFDNNLDRLFTYCDKEHLILTEDTKFELELLSNYSKIKKFRNTAKQLLDNCSVAHYNYQDFYKRDKTNAFRTIQEITVKSKKKFHLIFAFYDGTATEEFVYSIKAATKSDTMSYVKILYFNKNESYDTPLKYIQPTSLNAFSYEKSSFKSLFRATPTLVESTSVGLASPPMVENNNIYRIVDIKNSEEIKFNSNDLVKVNEGTSAVVYKLTTTESLKKPIAVKIFRKGTLSSQQIKYIKNLSIYHDSFENKVAFPTALVCNSKNACIGYTMQFFEGATPFSVFDPDLYDSGPLFTNEKIKDYARQISLILVELRLFELEMDDISGKNFSFLKNGNVIMIDTDSMETPKFISRKHICTQEFAHKFIYNSAIEGKDVTFFRPRSFNNFSYLVLLFWLYTFSHPLYIKGDCVGRKNWNSIKETGFTHCTANGESKHNSTSAELWKKNLNKTQRKMFCETFNYENNFSLGQIIGILNLSSLNNT